MTTPNSPSDRTIAEIHHIREQISAAFGGNLQAISADARQRQAASGRHTVTGLELAAIAATKPQEPVARNAAADDQ